MHPLARPRALGYLADCVGYVGIAAAMVPLGAIVHANTDLGADPAYAYLASTVPPAIAAVLAARAESGPRRATWGKRRQGLVVAGLDGETLSLGRALGRNVAKIFVPWQLGHMTAIGAVQGGFNRGDPVLYAVSFASYAVIGVYAWTGLRGSGRGVHDMIAGSQVTSAAAPRRARTAAT